MVDRAAVKTSHPEIIKIEGLDGIFLRLVQPGDADELYRVIEADKEHLSVFQRFARNNSPEKVRRGVERSFREMTEGRRLQYRIVLSGPEPKIIGNLTFYNRHDGVARLGYWIIQPYEGKGITLAAARTLIDYVFTDWGIKKVELTIDAKNERSQRLAVKLGAKPAGKRVRENDKGKEYEIPLWEIVNA